MKFVMNSDFTIRAGLSKATGLMPIEMEKRGYSALLSANALFNHRTKSFREVPMNLDNVDVALDSAGFVAMNRYGNYPWSLPAYCELAMSHPFAWWAQMDFCCEPEVANDRAILRERIHATAQALSACNHLHTAWSTQAPELHLRPAMPVLQGWSPDDYELSSELANAVLFGRWPDLVGIGSVCRRELGGANGIATIIARLDAVLPSHVRFHLFGVKGSAISELSKLPRVASVDSMAYEFRARVLAREAGATKTISFRAEVLEKWMDRQTGHALLSAQ